MKILHVAESAGGVEKYLQMLLPRLEAMDGVEQMLVCSTHFMVTASMLDPRHIERIEMPRLYNPLNIFRVSTRLRRIIKKFQPDIVYCHSSFAGVFGRLACIGTPVKTVYNAHGWAFDMDCSPLKRHLFKTIEQQLAKRTDLIINISDSELRSAARAHVGRPAQRIVIKNGIDFTPAASSVTRRDLGIPEDAFVIGMAARISPQKAPDIFLRIGAKVRETIPQTWLMIVGDGEQRQEMLRLARQLNMDDRLTITGWVKDAQPYLMLFDQALLMSRWEGFGLVIPEYAKAAKPVIASRVGAIPELISDGETGFLVEANSIDEPARLITEIHSDPRLRERLVSAALQHARSQFDIDRVASQTYDALTALLGGAADDAAEK